MSYMLDSISRLSAEIASLTAQLAAAKEERNSVYALGPHPVEQCQNISLSEFVSTRFVQVWEFNEKCDQLAAANAEIGRLKELQQQWEPQWNSIAEANTAGYNEAMEYMEKKEQAEIQKLEAEIERLRKIEAAAKTLIEHSNPDGPAADWGHYECRLGDWRKLFSALAGEEAK